MSKMKLFGSFAMGLPITLDFHHTIGGKAVRRDVTGYIQGIECESGYQAGSSPNMFNVRIVEDGKSFSVYVKTID